MRVRVEIGVKDEIFILKRGVIVFLYGGLGLRIGVGYEVKFRYVELRRFLKYWNGDILVDR